MNGLYIFGPIVTLILTALLKNRWHRLIALGVTIVLAIGFTHVVTNEVKKAVWGQSRIRIQEPTQRLLLEIQNDLNTGKTDEATALLSHMTTNWDSISVAPWMKSVDDVRREFDRKRMKP